MSRSVMELPLASRDTQRTVTRATRLNRDVDDKLVKLAEKDNVSANLLVNKALRRHVEWNAYADQFGFMCVPTLTMARIFDLLTEQEARELGAWSGEKQLPEMVNFWFKKLDLDGSLKLLGLLADSHGNAFKFDKSSDGKCHTLILRHEIGPKASMYYGEQLRSLFRRLGHRVETMETESQVLAKIFN